MIENFKLNPESVLIDFHKQCGLEYSNPLINKQKLLNALNDLRREDLEKEFLDLKCKSFFFFVKETKFSHHQQISLTN